MDKKRKEPSDESKPITVDSLADGPTRQSAVVDNSDSEIVDVRVVLEYGGRMTQFLRERYGDSPIVGAEIGVLNGDHAKELLTELNMQKLYLIDPYLAYDEYKDANRHGLAAARVRAVTRMKPYDNIVEWLFLPSANALHRITQQFDFVYIDGNHRKKYVHDDLWGTLPLICRNGVVGGHDYYERKDPENLCEVKEVVDEFQMITGSPLYLDSSYEHDWPDWWFVKDDAMEDALIDGEDSWIAQEKLHSVGLREI